MLLSLSDTFTKRIRVKMCKKYIKFSSYLAKRTTSPFRVYSVNFFLILYVQCIVWKLIQLVSFVRSEILTSVTVQNTVV